MWGRFGLYLSPVASRAVLVSIFGLSRQFYYDLYKKSKRSVDFKKSYDNLKSGLDLRVSDRQSSPNLVHAGPDTITKLFDLCEKKQNYMPKSAQVGKYIVLKSVNKFAKLPVEKLGIFIIPQMMVIPGFLSGGFAILF